MANGKIRFGKQSGGELALVIPDGVANTEVIVPESGVLATEQYIDSTAVKLTGNETIVGIKTFSSSPIVPVPTTNFQVSTKKYVDDATIINNFTNKTTPVDTDNLALQETGGLLKKLSWANLKATLFNGAISLTTNGYIKLPTVMGGLIIQWGFIDSVSPNGNYTAASYPIRFPNNCFQAIGGRDALGSNAVMLIGKAGGDPHGQVIAQNWGTDAGIAKYVAIGN